MRISPRVPGLTGKSSSDFFQLDDFQSTPKKSVKKLHRIDLPMFSMRKTPLTSKRNLTFNLLDPDQIRLTLCYTD